MTAAEAVPINYSLRLKPRGRDSVVFDAPSSGPALEQLPGLRMTELRPRLAVGSGLEKGTKSWASPEGRAGGLLGGGGVELHLFSLTFTSKQLYGS